MLNVADIEFLRRRFDRVNSYYGKKGLAPQLSLIRIEENLIDGQGVYSFNLKKEILSGCERNLKRNDLFVCVAIGIATRIEDEDKPNISVPDFSPAIANITASGSAVTINVPGFVTKDINALYNGSIFISTGTTVNFADLPTALFLRQQSDDVTKLASGYEHRQKVFDLENNLKTMAEELTFAGTQDHTIKVSFPTYASASYAPAQSKNSDGDVTSHNVSKIVFMALGWRVVGGTSEIYRNDEANPFKGCI